MFFVPISYQVEYIASHHQIDTENMLSQRIAGMNHTV